MLQFLIISSTVQTSSFFHCRPNFLDGVAVGRRCRAMPCRTVPYRARRIKLFSAYICRHQSDNYCNVNEAHVSYLVPDTMPLPVDDFLFLSCFVASGFEFSIDVGERMRNDVVLILTSETLTSSLIKRCKQSQDISIGFEYRHHDFFPVFFFLVEG